MGLLARGLLLLLVLMAGCARDVVWEERKYTDGQGKSASALLPLCPYCKRMVDYRARECRFCERDVSWVDRPDEEEE